MKILPDQVLFIGLNRSSIMNSPVLKKLGIYSSLRHIALPHPMLTICVFSERYMSHRRQILNLPQHLR